jgi:hypothetical protein
VGTFEPLTQINTCHLNGALLLCNVIQLSLMRHHLLCIARRQLDITEQLLVCCRLIATVFTAQFALSLAIFIPCVFGETVVEIVGNVGARLAPRLFLHTDVCTCAHQTQLTSMPAMSAS